MTPNTNLKSLAEELFRRAEELGQEATARGFASPDDVRTQHLVSELSGATRRVLLLARALVGEVEDVDHRRGAEAGQ